MWFMRKLKETLTVSLSAFLNVINPDPNPGFYCINLVLFTD